MQEQKGICQEKWAELCVAAPWCREVASGPSPRETQVHFYLYLYFNYSIRNLSQRINSSSSKLVLSKRKCCKLTILLFSDCIACSAKERTQTYTILVLWIYNNILLIYYATKIFWQNNIRKHLFITLFKTIHKSRRRNRKKYLKYIWIENWQMCNLKFSESAGWLFIPVAEKYRLLIGKISLVLVRLKYLLKS